MGNVYRKAMLIYPILCKFRQMAQPTYSGIVPLIYVNETICWSNLPFYKIQVNHFMASDELSGAILNSKTFLSFH